MRLTRQLSQPNYYRSSYGKIQRELPTKKSTPDSTVPVQRNQNIASPTVFDSPDYRHNNYPSRILFGSAPITRETSPSSGSSSDNPKRPKLTPNREIPTSIQPPTQPSPTQPTQPPAHALLPNTCPERRGCNSTVHVDTLRTHASSYDRANQRALAGTLSLSCLYESSARNPFVLISILKHVLVTTPPPVISFRASSVTGAFLLKFRAVDL